MYIGLLMVSHEDDLLAETLALHARNVDAYYVLDGTKPNDTSGRICVSHPECRGYMVDDDVPGGGVVRDGSRQFLYEQAVAEYGYDHWFLLLHADEVWTFYPWHATRDHPDADGFIFNLPCYFPREGEPYDPNRSALEQLRWHLAPGWPEFRMFRGAPGVAFDKQQHFNVTPYGLRRLARDERVIKHYPYRSPDSQVERAIHHTQTGFDPDNYQHVLDGNIYWSDEMIAKWQRRAQFRELVQDQA